jgi:hypothetical protein
MHATVILFQNRVDPNWTEEEKAIFDEQRLKIQAFKVFLFALGK